MIDYIVSWRMTHDVSELVGGFNPFEKILVKLVKLDHFPKVRGENKISETTT